MQARIAGGATIADIVQRFGNAIRRNLLRFDLAAVEQRDRGAAQATLEGEVFGELGLVFQIVVDTRERAIPQDVQRLVAIDGAARERAGYVEEGIGAGMLADEHGGA